LAAVRPAEFASKLGPFIVDRIRSRLKKAKRSYVRHIRSRIDTHRDPVTGFLYQNCFGRRVFLRSRRDYLDPETLKWLCEDLYFRCYTPSRNDVIVDVGAGYGHEAFYAISKSRDVRYFGIEVQPSIYEYLCNTLSALPDQCRAIGIAVSADTDCMYIASSENYTSATTTGKGYIEVPALPWPQLAGRYGIGEIDLLKVNIEGAERFLLPALGSMREIKRVVISAHDFRADEGHGEHFRTREFVRNYLTERGYRVRQVGDEDVYAKNWLFADREHDLSPPTSG
jgi:FkbM family methyltransferase